MVAGSVAQDACRCGTIDPCWNPSSDLARGALVGRYTVLSLVGRGRHGRGLRRVRSTTGPPGRPQAPRPRYGRGNRAPRRGCCSEARAIARLSHPNVIAVHDAGTVGDRIFVAMEYVDGQTLGVLACGGATLAVGDPGGLLGAARGLAAAHASGLIHRDFKPQNVMVARDGTARVTDFGLVQRLYGTMQRRRDRSGLRTGRRRAGIDPHAPRRADRNAALHVARAVQSGAHRRANRPVQLLRGALPGALRRAPVPGGAAAAEWVV